MQKNKFNFHQKLLQPSSDVRIIYTSCFNKGGDDDGDKTKIKYIKFCDYTSFFSLFPLYYSSKLQDTEINILYFCISQSTSSFTKSIDNEC